MSLELDEIVDDIPYTIPWAQELIDAFLDWPLDLWRRLNTIIDLFQWQCQGKLLLYVRTALPALGQLVLGLFGFDWDDVARGYFRPFGPMGHRGLITLSRLPKWKIEIPELGEEIGRRLPGARLVKASRVWRRTRALWFVDGLLQRGLYYWMLVDLISEFLSNWSIGILRAPEECGGAYVARGGTYGDSGGRGIKSLVIGGTGTEVVAVPGPGAGFAVAQNEFIIERPTAILGCYKLVSVFPLECRLRWRMGVAQRGSNVLHDPTPWAYVSPGSSPSVMSVFLPPRPGRWRLVAEVDWSTCSTIFQVLEFVAAKSSDYPLW